MLNVSVQGVRQNYYNKQCVGSPVAHTPDGQVINQPNNCVTR